MTRPIPTVRLLFGLFIMSLFLNVVTVLYLAHATTQVRSYQEECGDRSDAPTGRR